jgi:hypothetical protein
LKRDTSVEIVLAFNEERADHEIDVVVNNHFDADGVLAVWTGLRPELAERHRGLIIAAAEHGDFDLWPEDNRGIWLEMAISTLAGDLDDKDAYARVLPMLDELVPNISAREDLWGKAFAALEDVESLLTASRISAWQEGRIAVFSHARGVAELPGAWLAQLAPPGTDRMLLAFADADGGYRYRYELPRYAWADTVTRPQIPMPRRGPIKRRLGPDWIIKGRRGMTGVAYTTRGVAMAPEAVARALATIDLRSS